MTNPADGFSGHSWTVVVVLKGFVSGTNECKKNQ